MRKATHRVYCGLLTALLAVLLLVTVPAADVRAAGNTSWFDFSQTSANVTAGDSVSIRVNASADFDVYKIGSSNPGTIAKSTGSKGLSYVTIQIAPDETADQVSFAFYTRWTSERYYDIVTVNVKKRTVSEVGMTSAPIPFADGTAGAYATLPGSKICLVANSSSQPLAVFTISGRYGQEEMAVGAPVSIGGIVLLNVSTPNDPTARTIQIGEQDKANLVQKGVWGLALNNDTVFWP